MSDEDNLPSWRKKFLATRMTFESILFEKELVVPQKEKLSVGLLGAAGIWFFHVVLLAQWVLRRGYFFDQADAESFGAMLRYAAYLKSQGFWALLKPEFSDLTLNPPLYYLAYVPVLNYLTANLNLALIAVNSFFLLILALSVFLAVRRSRPNRAGWLGAAFALAMPFLIETARRPSPELALMAMAAALYACYIRSDDFEHPRWTFAFAVCLGLGFFAHRYFWLYALPLLPFIITGLASPYSRGELVKGFFPGLVLNLPWYLFALAAVAVGFVPVFGEAYTGFWSYFKLGAAAAGLPLFALGAAGLAWMYFSVFMPYEKKKIVAAWFWVPYLALTWGVRGSRPELLYPALLPFAVALPVMTPHQARKYLLIFVLALGAINQSGLVREFSIGRYPVAGLPLPPSGDYRAPELLALIKAGAPAGGGLVGIYGGDAGLNAGSFSFAAPAGSTLKFSDEPACPACAFMLIHKTPRFGEKASKEEAAFDRLERKSWFPAVFAKKAEFALADTSKAEVYVKTPARTKFFEEGTHQVKNLVLGEVAIEEGTLKLAGFDPASGRYAYAQLFTPCAAVRGGDVYGLSLDITGLSAAGPGVRPFVPAGVTGVKVRSASITAYAVERYLAGRWPFLKDLKVSLEDGLGVSALTRGYTLSARFSLAIIRDGVLEVRPVFFSLGPLTLPGYFLRLLTFKLDFSGNPYGIKISGLRFHSQMLELY